MKTTAITNPASPARRRFVQGSAAVAGSLVVGFHIPFLKNAQAQAANAEINAWVVVQPNDTVVIRIARSEMGQGTLTGLSQLVAEELECDWAKVTTEYPTPGQSLERKRPWGSFGTGGSQGIRGSQDYVRKGGATARLMLVQAAADEWKVPIAECSVTKGVILHAPSNRTTTYGKVAAMAAGASPMLLPTTASFASRPAFKTSAKVALESFAFGPSSHSIFNASSAVLARHQVSATTATALSPTRNTFFTPGRFSTAASSTLFTLPPNTGLSFTAAFNIPGNVRSIP